MEISPIPKQRPDVFAEKRTTRELVERILKLRWMGLEKEAREMELKLQKIESGATLLADPCGTD
ncbi:MAG TPA: hypothetical protein VGJ20_45490 [Xanthobacteraceae bacterium]|jgi:hypothetical protein